MEHLIFLFATHFLGDFPFQSEWMVMEKGRRAPDGRPNPNYEVLGYHVAVYVATNFAFSRLVGYHPTWQGVTADAVTHFVIDTLKSHGVIKQIWQDQLCHLTVRTVLWYLGWL